MKLKSLKIALLLLSVCMREHKSAMGSAKDYEIGKEAYKDIEGCIKAVEKQIEYFKNADIVDACMSLLTIPIIVDLPDRGYLKKDDSLNPYLRAEKIEKEGG